MLQIEPTKKGDGDAVGDTRKRFLHAYERTYGNVSASCEYAGISRQTYYRWMKSLTRTNRKFQAQLEGIRPAERLVDLAESKLVQKIKEGETAAILFALRTKGRTRDWSENPVSDLEVTKKSALEIAARGFRLWLVDNRDLSIKDQLEWMGRFARGNGVEVSELAAATGFGEPPHRPK